MTAQTDRELVERAAKAAGYASWDWLASDGVMNAYHADGLHEQFDPLNNDGEALRLAVRLGIAIELHPAWVYARAVMPNDHYKWHEITEGWAHTKEPYAATRRAIVRAAAELGKP